MADFSVIEQITRRITEDNENFIFETIRPFCEEIVQQKLSKKDINEAMILWSAVNRSCSDGEIAKYPTLTKEVKVDDRCGFEGSVYDTEAGSLIITIKPKKTAKRGEYMLFCNTLIRAYFDEMIGE